jgi:hypothetical protein
MRAMVETGVGAGVADGCNQCSAVQYNKLWSLSNEAGLPRCTADSDHLDRRYRVTATRGR